MVFIFTENEYNDIFVKKLKICFEFLIEKLKVKKKQTREFVPNIK